MKNVIAIDLTKKKENATQALLRCQEHIFFHPHLLGSIAGTGLGFGECATCESIRIILDLENHSTVWEHSDASVPLSSTNKTQTK